MASTIRFDGAEDLLAKFKAMGTAMRQQTLHGAVEPAAEIIANRISEAAPQLTGRLAFSIETVNLTDSEDRFVVGIQIEADAFYWLFLEFGTHSHLFNDETFKVIRGKEGLGDVRMKPHPFIRPAFRSTRNQARLEIRDGIRDQVEGFTE